MALQVQQDPPAIYTNLVFLPTTVLPIEEQMFLETTRRISHKKEEKIM